MITYIIFIFSCTGVELQPTQGSCHDKQPQICAGQKNIICTNDAYKNWAEENCQKTCETCPGNVTYRL